MGADRHSQCRACIYSYALLILYPAAVLAAAAGGATGAGGRNHCCRCPVGHSSRRRRQLCRRCRRPHPRPCRRRCVLLFAVGCLCLLVCWLLFVVCVCWLLLVVCCRLLAGCVLFCCPLFCRLVVCGLWFVVLLFCCFVVLMFCCVLFVVCCLLFVVCRCGCGCGCACACSCCCCCCRSLGLVVTARRCGGMRRFLRVLCVALFFPFCLVCQTFM